MNLLKKYERHISGLAFVVGFVLDYTFAPRIDNPYMPFVMGGYLGLAWVAILLHQTLGQKAVEEKWRTRFFGLLPTAIQFIFGALMSMLFVYYSRSAALEGSWPFMLLLGGMFVANEVFRDRVRLFKFQLGTFFFVSFMAATLAFPVILRELGTAPFLLAGLASLLATLFLIALIALYSRIIVRENILSVLGIVGGMYLIINGLYFTHLIPPIPLLLRDSGVYHAIIRDSSGNYLGSSERVPAENRFPLLGPREEILRLTQGESAYFYSAVFAPIAITTPVVHRWEYEDAQTKGWLTAHRVSFPIVGGRDGGYRGYSIKENVVPGRWRVSVESASGELLGRKSFIVLLSESPMPLEGAILK